MKRYGVQRGGDCAHHLARGLHFLNRATCFAPLVIMGGHGEFHFPRQASQEEMAAAKLDIAYRDSCAALLIPLNKWVVPRARAASRFSVHSHAPQYAFSPSRRAYRLHAMGAARVCLAGAGMKRRTCRFTAGTSGTSTRSANTWSEFFSLRMYELCAGPPVFASSGPSRVPL